MPYLRLYSLELPRELKRTMVTELTQAVVETRHLIGDERDGFAIQFMRFEPEDLAIGGKLIANGRRPDYHVEYSDHGLDSRDKKKLAKEITETVARVLDGNGAGGVRINVQFRDYLARDFAVGGALPEEHHRPGRVKRLFRRLIGVVPLPRLRRRKRARVAATQPRPA